MVAWTDVNQAHADCQSGNDHGRLIVPKSLADLVRDVLENPWVDHSESAKRV